MIEETLLQETARMNQAIEWCRKSLANAPEGRLSISESHGTEKWYWRKHPTDNKGIYLGKKDSAKRSRLAQKEYTVRLLRAATDEKARLEKALAAYNKGVRPTKKHPAPGQDPLLSVYENLTPLCKDAVVPYVVNDEEYARQWGRQDFVGNGYPFSTGGFVTKKGETVRSKSELIIADQLEAAGVPYRYEQELFLDEFSPVYPDFTVLNTRTRKEFAWEHLGAMGDPDYCHSALHKLNRYAAAGYLPGDKLLVTQESSSAPLDTRMISALIDRFLK